MVEHLGVRLLGEFELVGADLAALRSRKARTLLKVLALADGAPVGTSELIEAIWTDELTSDPPGDLAVLASRARSVVGAEHLVRRGDGYALLVDSSDRSELAALANEATRRFAGGDLAASRSAASAALALVRGPVLAEEGERPWLARPRAAVAAIEADVRLIAAEGALAAGHPREALQQARTALAHDPYDEAALRVAMRAHMAVGRPGSALAAYAEVRARLADDLGVSPSAATETLHTAVLLGEPQPRLVASAPDAPPLVGRDGEVARLDAALERSRAAAEVVLVIGEPGIGKSALLRTWAARCRERGVAVGLGRADGSLDLALQPVADALAQLDHDQAAFGSALPAPSLSGQALVLQRFEEVSAALAAVRDRDGRPGGLVVLIDDGDRSDGTTRAWLRHVLRRAGDHRFLTVVTWADGAPIDVPSTVQIRLDPLPLEAVAQLVGADRAVALLERSGGNPLLLVELAGAVAGDEIPATLRDAVGARLLHAGEAVGTLRTAAVIGPELDLDLVARVSGRSPTLVLEHLDAGVRHGFLVERAGTIGFRHALVRETVAAGTTSPRRAWIHREAARLLAQRRDTNPLQLARHARLGGDDALAAEGLTAAAALARTRLDLEGAEAMLDEAIIRCDHVAARLQRARTRMARDDLVGADSDAIEALAMGAGAEALELRAWAARNRHDMETAVRLGRAGAEAATDPNTRASCKLAVALAHRGVGDLRQADELLQEVASSQPHPSLGLAAWMGGLRVHQGRPADALQSLEPLLGSQAGPMHSFWVEHVLQMTVHAYGMVGRITDALAVLDRLERELERRGTAMRYAGMPATYRSWLLRNVRDPAATDAAREAVETAGTTEVRTQARLDLADAMLSVEGDVDAARAIVQQATADMDVRWFHNRWRCEQRAGLLRARIHLSAGDAERAARDAAEVEAAARERGDERYAALARLLGARAAGRAGDVVDADAVITDCMRARRAAALEAWWVLADVAADTGLDAVHRLAGEAGASLVRDAGRHGATLRVALARAGL